MTVAEGKIETVYAQPIGDALSGDHASGVTTLYLADVGDFSEEGGQLQIDDDVYTYSDFDDEDDTLTITPGLLNAYEGGQLVALYPVATELVADVTIEEGEESITAVISHSLKAMVLEGIRAPLDQENVVMNDDLGYWLITEVVGREPNINGGMISKETVIPNEAMTDGDPPDHSPEVVLVPGLKVIYAKWDPVVNNDLVKYEVHVNTVSFTPTAGDPLTLVSITPGSLVSIRTLADNSPLDYDVDYFVRIIATDEDGAAAPGVEHSAQMDKTGIGDIAPNSITTEMLDTVLAIIGLLQVGSLIEISPPTNTAGVLGGGIIVKDPANPTGEPLVRLHPDGCSFKGKVVTDILTVMQDLIINGGGVISSGAYMQIQNGVATPTAAAAMQGGRQQGNWNVSAMVGYVQRGICWDAANSRWLRLLVPTSGTVAGRIKVQPVNTAGTAGSSTVMDTTGYNETDANGIICLGTSVYMMVMTASGWRVYEYSMTTGAFLRRGNNWSHDNGVGRPNLRFQPGGTSVIETIGIMYYDTDLVSFSRLTRTTLAVTYTGSQLSTNLMSSQGYGMRDISYFGSGADAPTATAYIANANPDTSIPSMLAFTISTASPPVFARVQADEFDLEAAATSGGIGWDGSNFFSVHGSTAAVMYKYSPYIPSAGEKWWVQYEDTGGGNHTGPSPVGSRSLAARTYMTVTLRPAPTGVTGADVWVGYGSTLPGTFYKRSETLSGRTLLLSNGKVLSGSTVIPAGNTMGGTPGELRAEVGGFKVKGDSSGDWPELRAKINTERHKMHRRVTSGVAVNISSAGTSRTIPFGDSRSPTVGISIAASNDLFTITKAGRYQINVGAMLDTAAAAASGRWTVRLVINGSNAIFWRQYRPNVNEIMVASLSGSYDLDVNDVISVETEQTFGNTQALNTGSTSYNHIDITLVDA